MGVKARLLAIPLDFKALARSLDCSPRTVNDQVRRFGKVCPWAAQAKHFEVFLHPPTRGKPFPRYYVISRHASDRIGKGARPCLRWKAPPQWREHQRHMRKLAWGIVLRGKKKAECKHKTLSGNQPSVGGNKTGLARPPPRAFNRPRWRSLRKLCFALAFAFRENGPRVEIPKGYLARFAFYQFQEGHSFEQILKWLLHADSLVKLTGDYSPRRPSVWVCSVAARHLDRDGLAPVQRRRDRAAEFRKAAFNEAEKVPAVTRHYDPQDIHPHWLKLEAHKRKDAAWQQFRLAQYRLGISTPSEYPPGWNDLP
jgi:hypothetical protein